MNYSLSPFLLLRHNVVIEITIIIQAADICVVSLKLLMERGGNSLNTFHREVVNPKKIIEN